MGDFGERTLSKQEDLFPASCRARSRRRSYSASASLLEVWLNAVTKYQFNLLGDWGLGGAEGDVRFAPIECI
jgi:hypothetical protein